MYYNLIEALTIALNSARTNSRDYYVTKVKEGYIVNTRLDEASVFSTDKARKNWEEGIIMYDRNFADFGDMCDGLPIEMFLNPKDITVLGQKVRDLVKLQIAILKWQLEVIEEVTPEIAKKMYWCDRYQQLYVELENFAIAVVTVEKNNCHPYYVIAAKSQNNITAFWDNIGKRFNFDAFVASKFISEEATRDIISGLSETGFADIKAVEIKDYEV